MISTLYKMEGKYCGDSLRLWIQSHVSTILQSVDIIVSQSLIYIFMGEYQVRRAHFYFTSPRFSVLVIIKQQENGSRSINMKNHHKFFSHYVEYEYHCRIYPLTYFNWSILFQMCSFIFHITQIQCLGHDKIVEIWLLIHKYEELPQGFLPFCRVWISLFHRAFDIFLWVNIN